MSNAQAPLRSVAVFGGGLVALSAALGFARALPAATVTLVLTPLDPAALADRLPATAAGQDAILARLGLDPATLVASGAATQRVATRFADWNADGSGWTWTAGETPAAVGAAAFHQLWLDARRRGAAERYDAYAPGAAIALAERFAPAPIAGWPPSPEPALRLDPGIAGSAWLDALQRAAVQIAKSSIADVRRDAARVAAIVLNDGKAITADLFVDATGPGARIAGGDDWIDWNAALPVDRLVLHADPTAAPSPLDRYTALDAGWRARWPLGRMTLQGLGYAAATTTEGSARALLGGGGAQAQCVALRPGRQRTIWRGNVLALGDAAVVPGPLGATGFALALAQLALALDLLPGRSLDPLLLGEFNRRAGLRADRQRDFLAAHYHAQPPRRGPFWQALRDHAVPLGLAETLRQFARRGSLPHFEEDMARVDWIALLLGRGLIPQQRDPIAMAADPAATDAALARLHAAVAALPGRLPAYPAYLAALPRSRA